MTDTYTYDADDDPRLPAQEDPGTIRRLRAAAREGQAARKEVAALSREVAMRKAGVALDTPLGQLFVRAYDGDDEGVADAWAEVAPPPPPAPSEDEEEDDPNYTGITLLPGEERSTDERNALQPSGGNAGPAYDPDPRLIADQVAGRMRADDATEADVLAVHFGILASAAEGGDKRVRLN